MKNSIFNKVIFFIIFCIVRHNISYAGFSHFDYQENPSQPVTHAGALLIKKYPANHPDGHGEQFCMLMGHDRNLDLFAPPAGSVDKSKDFFMSNGRQYYLSYKTIQREVLEETGGVVNLTDDFLQKCPMLYSQKFHDLLAVVRDDNLSCATIGRSVELSIENPLRDASWKEMDYYCTFPVDEVIATAQVMKVHFDEGGSMENLPPSILSARKANHLNSPLVWVKCRGTGTKLEMCAYYMAAIADTLPQLQQIIKSWG